MKPAKRLSLALLLLAFLSIGPVCNTQTHNTQTHDDAFSDAGLLKADASDLQHTIVTPHLEAPVTQDQNILWCGSFQLAWNEAISLVKEDLHFDNDPAMVLILNKQSFTKQDLDAQSYVAVAGFVRDDVFGQIERQLQETFKGQATPQYIPSPDLTPRPQDIVVYSYLFKNLEFPIPFERVDEPLVFGTERVPCFGIGEKYKPKHVDMLEQLAILDYQSEDDFVIELKTKSTLDRVILAKTQPQATLEALVAAVGMRATNVEPTQPRIGDILKVPKLNVDITRQYDELTGKRLLVTNPNVAQDLFVLSALQNVRFQFDEKGVRLRSESHIAFGCSAQPTPSPPKHIMVFDKPFLILLQRQEAKLPYFALWVGNPELLVKANE